MLQNTEEYANLLYATRDSLIQLIDYLSNKELNLTDPDDYRIVMEKIRINKERLTRFHNMMKDNL